MTCHLPEIVLELGDITQQAVDAIVNAGNSELILGAGVAGAIRKRGGPSIQAELDELRANRFREGLPTGAAVPTSAGNLPARWVIHTAGPVYNRTADQHDLLAACHKSCLQVADELGATTIAFPAISTGVYGYPVDLAASTAIDAVRKANTKADQVRFVLFDAMTYETFSSALSNASSAGDRTAKVGTPTAADLFGLVEDTLARANMPDAYYHGQQHWRRVAHIGLRLLKTVNADPLVVFLFALFHDSMRVNEGKDPGHGSRGSLLGSEIIPQRLDLPAECMKMFMEACDRHTEGTLSSDPTVGACWDTDRLDLYRVGTKPDPRFMSTGPAREASTIEWTIDLLGEDPPDWKGLCETYATSL